jgi:hypothetical protein
LIFNQSPPRPPGRYRGVQALGDDPLQGLLLARGEQRGPLADEVRRDLHTIAVKPELKEALAPLEIRQIQEGLSVQPQQIEDHVARLPGTRIVVRS